jgi:hypothetical protein
VPHPNRYTDSQCRSHSIGEVLTFVVSLVQSLPWWMQEKLSSKLSNFILFFGHVIISSGYEWIFQELNEVGLSSSIPLIKTWLSTIILKGTTLTWSQLQMVNVSSSTVSIQSIATKVSISGTSISCYYNHNDVCNCSQGIFS